METKLSAEFVDKEMVYTRVMLPELKKNYYIYQVNYKWYEVFYTTRNRLPSDEAFGKTAYCCRDLDEARRCLKVLESKQE